MTAPRELPRFDTAHIGPLRDLLNRFAKLKPTIGDFVRFRVVVDANFVIQDLTQRVRHPERGTALEELIRATVVDAYAPRWLDTEMVSAIEQTAEKRRLPVDALQREWLSYRQLLRWDDSLRVPDGNSAIVADPKDTPYIVLEDKIAAHGILSKDAHIKQMGGHPLTLDFVLSVRRYARGAVACVSIRFMGVLVSMIALQALTETLRGTGQILMRLPDAVKVLLLLLVIAALLHPGARKWISGKSGELCELLAPCWSVLWDIMVSAASLASEAQVQATVSLTEASAAARPRLPTRLPRRRTRRVGGGSRIAMRPLVAGAATVAS